MARIPESEIERIKREVSVQRLVEACGIALTKIRQRPDWAVPVPQRPPPELARQQE